MKAKIVFTDEEIKAILSTHFRFVLENLDARITHIDRYYSDMEVTISNEKKEV